MASEKRARSYSLRVAFWSLGFWLPLHGQSNLTYNFGNCKPIIRIE